MTKNNISHVTLHIKKKRAVFFVILIVRLMHFKHFKKYRTTYMCVSG